MVDDQLGNMPDASIEALWALQTLKSTAKSVNCTRKRDIMGLIDKAAASGGEEATCRQSQTRRQGQACGESRTGRTVKAQKSAKAESTCASRTPRWFG